MATSVKLICLDKDNDYGYGYTSIMKNKSSAIAVDDYAQQFQLQDSGCVNQPTKFVKGGKVYTAVREYYDIDSKTIYIIAKNFSDECDIWPLPNGS